MPLQSCEAAAIYIYNCIDVCITHIYICVFYTFFNAIHNDAIIDFIYSNQIDWRCRQYNILGHFSLSGHADEGVEAWGEKLLPKGVLSLADFRKHGVELDLSDTHVVASGFQELEEFVGRL